MAAKVIKTGGDDLEDDLDLDPALLASSDQEEGSEVDDLPFGEGEGLEGDEEAAALSHEEVSEGESAPKLGKRKATSIEDMTEEEQKSEKKRRKKEKEKERKEKKRQATSQNAVSGPATHLTTSQLDELLLKSIRETFPSATPMEIDDIRIPESHLLPPPSYPIPDSSYLYPLTVRTSTAQLKSQSRSERRSNSSKSKSTASNGTPQIIILALSGLRCADLVRAVKPLSSDGQGEIAKLFAKHFKVSEQVTYLAKTKVGIAVGTPGRVGKLLEEGALKVTDKTVILLDTTHQDSKTRTLLTLPEARVELWNNVFGGPARKVLLDGGARVAAF